MGHMALGTEWLQPHGSPGWAPKPTPEPQASLEPGWEALARTGEAKSQARPGHGGRGAACTCRLC